MFLVVLIHGRLLGRAHRAWDCDAVVAHMPRLAAAAVIDANEIIELN